MRGFEAEINFLTLEKCAEVEEALSDGFGRLFQDAVDLHFASGEKFGRQQVGNVSDDLAGSGLPVCAALNGGDVDSRGAIEGFFGSVVFESCGGCLRERAANGNKFRFAGGHCAQVCW